jgi:hypothetical protein
MTNTLHPQLSPVRSSLRCCHQPWQSENGVIWLTHPANGPADSECLKLTITPDCDLVDLGHIHLDGHIVVGANDAIAGGALLWHLEVHKLAGIILHVGAAPAASKMSVSTESRIVLNLWKGCKDSSHIPFMECHLLTTLHHHGTFVSVHERQIQVSLGFLLTSFFYFRIPSEVPGYL